MPAWALSRLLFLALVATCAAGAHAEERLTGTIRGVQMVNVRSGPGTEYPPLRSLREGSQVEVQSIQDTWARVLLPDGRVGYVNSAFLQLRTSSGEVPQQGVVATPPAAGVRATVPARPTPLPTAQSDVATRVAATATLRQPPRSPTASEQPDVRSNTPTGTPTEQARVEASSAPPAQAPAARAADAAPPFGANEADLRRVLRLTEEMHREVVGGNAAAQTGASDAPGVATTLALTCAGLVIGFLIGTVSGRYQERNRRNRVRF